jgi:hypothetical protein
VALDDLQTVAPVLVRELAFPQNNASHFQSGADAFGTLSVRDSLEAKMLHATARCPPVRGPPPLDKDGRTSNELGQLVRGSGRQHSP